MTIGTDGTITAELVDQVTGGEAGASYTVQKGDSLSRIAKRELGSYNLWNVIYEANRDQLSNPNVIRPGQVLTIPGSQTAEDGRRRIPQTAQFIADIEAQFQETPEYGAGHHLRGSDGERSGHRRAPGEKRGDQPG